jgi:hypothetical protein
VSFLLDTNVISEWAKPRPNAAVIAWLAAVEEDRTYLSVASIAEIARDVALLPGGRRRDRLAAWLDRDLPTRFSGRLIGIDLRVAAAWGALMARSQSLGLGTGTMDGFFAATAAAYDLTLVTRNVRDFEGLSIRLLNPWDSAATESD